MKHVKKIFAAAMALFVALAVVALPAFADQATGSITISNAAKGETYSAYKLFDATVGANGAINYTSTDDIPSQLTAYFTKDSAGNITVTAAGKGANEGELSDNAKAALTAWVAAQVEADVEPNATAEGDGNQVVFSGLPYGYYVVTTTQGNTAISVDSTNPDATIIDKNTTTVINNPTKTADDKNVKIGDTVTYTVKFGTANYDGTKQVLSYEISDNFANGVLTDVKVTSITVGGTAITTQQFTNGKITIPWVDASKTSLYDNGAELVITYTATVANSAAVDGEGNTNTVTIKCIKDGGEPSERTVTETIYTYAFAIKKVNQAGEDLAGAVFELPFYVNASADTDGAYVYAGTEDGEGLTNEVTTPANGLIVVKGVKSEEAISITEKTAPNGYNKLTANVTVTPTKTNTTTTSTTTYLDKDGNVVEQQTTDGSTVNVSINNIAATPVVVVNKAGTEMPSTGGIGTTIFYVVGGVMVAGAAIFLLTKRRMAGNQD